MMWRVDCVKGDEQWPLVVDIPTQMEADALVTLFGSPTTEWDRLVAVEDIKH